MHGYALVEDVLRLSDGQVRLHTGTLYGVLDRLREAGLVIVDHEEIVESRLRRYYALTDAGIARLAAESRTDAAQRQRGREPAPPAAARGGRGMRRRRDIAAHQKGARSASRRRRRWSAGTDGCSPGIRRPTAPPTPPTCSG